MPDKPILQRNGSVITKAAANGANAASVNFSAASQYLDHSIHDIIITHKRGSATTKDAETEDKEEKSAKTKKDQAKSNSPKALKYQLPRQEKS